jgi:hypothetical protein
MRKPHVGFGGKRRQNLQQYQELDSHICSSLHTGLILHMVEKRPRFLDFTFSSLAIGKIMTCESVKELTSSLPTQNHLHITRQFWGLIGNCIQWSMNRGERESSGHKGPLPGQVWALGFPRTKLGGVLCAWCH